MQADGERTSWKGNVDEERGKRYARLSSCENVIGALQQCKWQDSCGSLCFILIGLSLPDLSHIPQNTFKARNKKKPRCMMASFTNHSSQGHRDPPPVYTGAGFGLGVRQTLRGSRDPTKRPRSCRLMSASFCVDTVLRAVWKPTKLFCFTLCWLIASKHLETVVWASVFVQASNAASSGTWRPAPDIIYPAGRNAGTREPGECDGGIYLSALFWQIQADRELINSAWLVPLPVIKYVSWRGLPNVSNVCIPDKCLKIDDTKTYLFSSEPKVFETSKVSGTKPAEFFKC